MTQYLSREEILGYDDLKIIDVSVPQWGGNVVRLKELTGRDRDAFEQENFKGRIGSMTVNLDNLRARLVALCAVDANGERLFSKDDVKALGKKSSQAIQLLFEECQKLCGLTSEDVEELAGNLDATPNGSSNSA